MPVVDQSSPVTDVQQAVPVAQEDREAAKLIQRRVAEGLREAGFEVDETVDDPWLIDLLARHRLASLPCKSGEGAGEIDGLTRRVAEVVNEDGGCWTACSGCQESDEGYVSEKYYPYSPIFQCQPGGGCSECGGIGVIWQDGAFLASYGDALSEDATQTREAELVALADKLCEGRDGTQPGLMGAYRQGMRDLVAALNARGGA